MAAELGFEQSGEVGRKLLMQSYDTIVSQRTHPPRGRGNALPSQSLLKISRNLENGISKQGKGAGFYDCAPVNMRVSSLRSLCSASRTELSAVMSIRAVTSALG
jgi:hypothetical protein